MTDLLEFLTQKGKYLPLPLDKVATVVSTKGMFYSRGRPTAERLVFADWKPKTFEGVPFLLVDPQGDKVPNVDPALRPAGEAPAEDAEVGQRCRATRRRRRSTSSSGVSGWGYPVQREGHGVDDRPAALRRTARRRTTS